MANVIFYEKPGCGGNARQKALLVASGHAVDVRNLLTEPWTASSLRQFLEGEAAARMVQCGIDKAEVRRDQT